MTDKLDISKEKHGLRFNYKHRNTIIDVLEKQGIEYVTSQTIDKLADAIINALEKEKD